MVVNILLVAVAGGLLCLDRVLVQTMISRPIVAAPLIGALLGDPYTGLVVGAWIELLWIDRLPIGAYVLPNDTVVSILMTACSIESGRILGHLPQGLIALTALLFVPFGSLVKRMDSWIIGRNEKAANEALASALEGLPPAIGRFHLQAAIRSWLLPASLMLVAMPAGIAVIAYGYPLLPFWMVRGLDLFYAFLPLIGVAVLLNTVHLHRAVPVFCAIFLMSTAVLRYIRG